MQEKNKIISDISEKLQRLITATGNNANSFAKKLGYDRSQAIYDILNGKSHPSYDFFKRLKDSEYSAFSIDQYFFDAVNTVISVNEPAGCYGVSKITEASIPIIPYSAVAGINGFSISVLNDQIETYLNLPIIKEKADYAFQIEGDSMTPTFPEGCYVVCKRITAEEIIFDKVYLISVDHSPMLKRILPGDKHNYTLRSDNPLYRDFSVQKSTITSISKIICSIKL
jgi:SOS-response transcriptional repressor LexA